MATSCEKALDYYRRVATSVAEEVSFSGGQTLQRVRLQVGTNRFDSGNQQLFHLNYTYLHVEYGIKSRRITIMITYTFLAILVLVTIFKSWVVSLLLYL